MKIELVEEQGFPPPYGVCRIMGNGEHLGYLSLNSLDSIWRMYLFYDTRRAFFKRNTSFYKWFDSSEACLKYLEGRIITRENK